MGLLYSLVKVGYLWLCSVLSRVGLVLMKCMKVLSCVVLLVCMEVMKCCMLG